MYSNAPAGFGDNGDMQMQPEGVPDEMAAAAAAGGARKKGAPQNNALTPVTIAALLNAQHDQLTKQFMHGNRPLQHVELVGVPVQVIPAPSSRSVTLMLEDGSGRIEVTKVLNEIGAEEEAKMYEQATSTANQNGSYLRIFGKLIEYRSNVFAASATRQVTAHIITKVDDPNLLTWTWARAICQQVESDMGMSRARWEQSNSAPQQPQQQQSAYGQSQSAPPRPMPQPLQQQHSQQYGGYSVQQPQQQYQQQAAPMQFMNMPPPQQQQQRGPQSMQPQPHMQMHQQSAPRPLQSVHPSHNPAPSAQMAAASQSDRMLEYFREQSELPGHDSGVPIKTLARTFGITEHATKIWITQLSQQGLAYSTLNEEHWKRQRTLRRSARREAHSDATPRIFRLTCDRCCV